jgi:hypothetical protein
MLTSTKLRELLKYDPATGQWEWLVRRSGTWPGRKAGTPNGEGRIQIRIDGTKYYAARLAWLYMTGEWPTEVVDHINRVNNDDRWENLREASLSQNATNSDHWVSKHGLPRGVHKVGRGFQSRISVDGKRVNLGFFTSPDEAHKAYLKASEFRAEFLPGAA